MSGETPTLFEAAETGRLPHGYKQTEVGVIPEDWGTSAVGMIAKFSSGESISVLSLQNQSSEFSVPVFGGNGIAGFTKDSVTRDPTIIVGRVGQKCGVVYRSTEPSWITDNALYPKQFLRPIDLEFFALALEAAGLNDVRNRNDLPLITQSIMHSTRIVLPSSIDEQHAIASALSDVDGLIFSLDRLTSKKRAVKTAAMQQLLTGKWRLRGFSGEWETRRLGDILTIRHGKSQHGVVTDDGPYPILATGGEIGRSNTFLYDRPSVLIGRKGTIDRPQYQESPFWTVDTLFYSEVGDLAHPKFMYYRFLTIDWRSHNEASGVPSLNSATIENIEIELPGVREQSAIATVLSDIDAEIDALEARREKTRRIKQGMMQELLTGRTRLVPAGA